MEYVCVEPLWLSCTANPLLTFVSEQGKTIQAIALIGYMMEFKQNLGPFLVIVPLSTLSNWQNEFAKWCPAARTVCYKGTPVQRREIYKDQVRAGHFNVLLTTYEYIIRDKKYLRQNVWQYAIVDEGHRMKNAGSKFAVTLGTQYTTKFRILLTGTPLMNDLSELWSLLNFLLPTIFNSVTTFDQWFSAPFAQFGGSSNNDDQEQDLLTNEERVLIIHRLHELLRPFMLRRVKSEVLDQLPEKVEKVLRCELSSWQKELYKQISKKAVAENGLLDNSAAATVPTRGLNNVVMQLRKVCNHPLLFSPEGYHINENIIRSSGKIALLDEMLPKLKAAGHRVLMFTQMTAVMTILEDYFSFRGYRSLRLDGSTPAEEREKRMYRYNAPDSPCFIFLLSTRAGGLGLNLVSGDTVILFDSDCKFEQRRWCSVV
jgi:ATP-dependent helicase STH1/SNF2